MQKIKNIFIVLVILIITSLIRLIALDKAPSGLYLDEASIGYNAYSILQTGQDEYGKSFPLFFRSFATFQSPLYAYLTTIPIFFFGLNIFSIRLLSAVCGILLTLITYFMIRDSKLVSSKPLAIFSSLVLSVSPWAIFQSRVAVEANLALFIFVLSLYFFLKSLDKIIFFIPFCITLAISAYAYHGERPLAFIFLPTLFFLYRNYFKNFKKIVISGILIFILISLPQLLILTTDGSLNRFSTKGFTSEESYLSNGKSFHHIPILGRYFYITYEFSSQYLSVFSPRSLFFEGENQTFRSIPDLSAFYFWMIIPFFAGIKYLFNERRNNTVKIIIVAMILGSLPKALTVDPFYTLRFLPTLWGFSILIGFGIFNIFQMIKNLYLKIAILISISILSFIMFYSSYFILLKNERSYAFGYPYLKLAEITQKDTSQKFLVDTEIYDAPYILLAFYKKLEPKLLQQQSDPNLIKNYYSDTSFNKYRKVDNVDFRPLKWDSDLCIKQVIVGDSITISKDQAQQHQLKLINEIKDLAGNTILWLYQASPETTCGK